MSSKFWKVPLFIITALVLISFIPYVQECKYVSSDVKYCTAHFPHKSEYWKHAFLTLTLQEETGPLEAVQWDSFGRFYILQEGIGDTFRALKNLVT